MCETRLGNVFEETVFLSTGLGGHWRCRRDFGCLWSMSIIGTSNDDQWRGRGDNDRIFELCVYWSHSRDLYYWRQRTVWRLVDVVTTEEILTPGPVSWEYILSTLLASRESVFIIFLILFCDTKQLDLRFPPVEFTVRSCLLSFSVFIEWKTSLNDPDWRFAQGQGFQSNRGDEKKSADSRRNVFVPSVDSGHRGVVGQMGPIKYCD